MYMYAQNIDFVVFSWCLHVSKYICILLFLLTVAARPTMAELIITDKKDGSDESLQVIQKIASASSDKCYKFAHKLLGDDDTIEQLQMLVKKDEEFVPLVLNEWLERDDAAVPRTWEDLAQCLEWANMDIEFIRAIDPRGELQVVLFVKSPFLLGLHI